MRELLNQWNLFLASSGSAFGAMALATGLAFLFIGWRIGRIAITIIYTIVGIGIGVALSGDTVSTQIGGALGAVIFGGLSRIFHRYAGPILAGAIGSTALWMLLGDSTVPKAALYLFLVLAFIAVGAPAMSNRKTTTIVLTSFVGAALIASGLTALATDSRMLLPHFRAMAAYGIFYPFLLIVSTIVGIVLQSGARQRKDGGEVGF